MSNIQRQQQQQFENLVFGQKLLLTWDNYVSFRSLLEGKAVSVNWSLLVAVNREKKDMLLLKDRLGKLLGTAPRSLAALRGHQNVAS